MKELRGVHHKNIGMPSQELEVKQSRQELHWDMLDYTRLMICFNGQ